MRKKHGIGIGLLLGAIVCIGLLMATYASEAEAGVISVKLNGKSFEVPATAMVDGQVMVPLSFLKRTFGEDGAGAGPELSEAAHYSDRVAVLMYHHMMEKSNQDDIISADQFDEQMRLLKTNGYHAIGLDQYRDFMLHGKPIPNNAVLITFDDGYESFYRLAYPILKKYGYPAVNFVIVSKVDDPGQPGIPKLRWDQMREMKKAGMSFMSHTYNLHSLGEVNPKGGKKPLTVGRLYLKEEGRQETIPEYEQRVRADLSLAEARLREELGNTYGAVAFPYGKYNAYLMDLLREMGIELSFTTESGINTNVNTKAFRINAGRSDTSPDAFINMLFGYGIPSAESEDPNSVLTVNGKTIKFSKVIKEDQGEGPLVSLKEFCEQYHVKMEWDKRKKEVSLVA
ncbi:polysaccharide deacetylase family protein [Cohnella nanjingensis]|uniref:Polysaccharide deacetylase family protein n=1 Tax=Cohnella nanjingensis TaxID=1387779 RepID=A0A7X0RNV3_9BACL|nr:polysaccharide deacetylase family protein [Cohnella nanjingensis]MBB6670977.1 polysaccharide deacetylase family protein [Cohnella nanjingensis]